MVVGSIIVALALCLLGWAKEVVGYWVSTETEFGKTWAIVLAILAIYVVDFAINAGEAGLNKDVGGSTDNDSNVELSKSNCRHTSSRKAARRCCVV